VRRITTYAVGFLPDVEYISLKIWGVRQFIIQDFPITSIESTVVRSIHKGTLTEPFYGE